MGELFDAVLDVTIAYPDGVPRFWVMLCGDRVDVEVDVRVRALEPALISGDYEGDRIFRRKVHQWLADIWQDKDDLLAAAVDDSQSGPTVA